MKNVAKILIKSLFFRIVICVKIVKIVNLVEFHFLIKVEHKCYIIYVFLSSR